MAKQKKEYKDEYKHNYVKPRSEDEWKKIQVNTPDYILKKKYREYIKDREAEFASNTSYLKGAGYVDTRKPILLRSKESYKRELSKEVNTQLALRSKIAALEAQGINKKNPTQEYVAAMVDKTISDRNMLGLEVWGVKNADKIMYQVGLYGRTMYDEDGVPYLEFKGFAVQNGVFYKTNKNGYIDRTKHIVYQLGI